jgi:hypothetical protein
MIFMTHEKHGGTHTYTEAEAVSLEKNGWKRDTFEAWGKRTKPGESDHLTETRDEVIKAAEKLGIEIDKRWNIGKLKAAINGNRE